MKWRVTKEQEPILLREYLKEIQGFSRRIIKGIKFHNGSLLVNGDSVTVRKELKEGDIVEVLFPTEQRGSFMKAESIPLDIIYEDDAVLVINKDAYIATIPSMHQGSGSIANGILHHYELNDINYTVHIVTRLDRDTSGLLLVAKHRLSHSILAKSQKAGEIQRRYQAIISGHLEAKKGTIDQPIARKPGSIIERMVDESGKRAVTHYQVVQELAGYTLLNIGLETGRTHQIRVHFAHLGHPLVGDDLYGGDSTKLRRQALHCTSLTFEHPITKVQHTFKSELPNDLKQIIQQGESIL